MITKILKIALPIVFIVAGIMVAGWMMSNKPVAERVEHEERITAVEVLETFPSTEPIIVSVKGTVTPAKQVVINPQVSGNIIDLSSRLVPGGLFRQGEELLKIDPQDYQFNVEAMKERVADAQYRLKMEKGQQAVAKQEWELMEDTIPATQEGKELALRQPQIEKATASLEAAQSALKKAELDLSRTTIRAPFNALVISENVDRGQVVSPQTPIATLAGTDKYWVQVSVPVEDLSWISIPGVNASTGSEARIVLEGGIKKAKYQGKVTRLLGNLGQAGRLARLLIEIDDPLNLKSKNENGEKLPLLIGSYVSVELLGSSLENVYVIPRKALRDIGDAVAGEEINSGWVYVMNGENRLDFRQVVIPWRMKDAVLVSEGLEPGDKVITSGVPTPVRGMKLETLNAQQQ